MIAVIIYMKNDDKKNFFPFYDKIPKKFKNFIIKKYKPFLISNGTILNTDIYYITVPLYCNEKKDNYEKWYDTMSYTIEKINSDNKIDVDGIILPDDDIFYSGIPIFRGKFINSILSFEISKKAMKIMAKDISKSEFLIVDGDDILTMSALKSLIGNVNFISIFTDRQSFFDDIKIYSEKEYGLIINTFSSSKNEGLKNADVIINCSNDNENYDYYYKRNSIYIDLVKNKSKTTRISIKRADMLFIDGIGLKTENGFIKSQILEALNYIDNNEFKKYIDYGNDIDNILNIIRKQNINISSLYFIDKPIIK